MSLLQEEITTYLEERGWGQLPPGDLAKSISIEAAELLEHFQWSSPTTDEIKNNPEMLEKIRHEMADVITYAIDLCVVLEIDFEKAVLEKLALIKDKYPPGKVRGSMESYYKLKEEHRNSKKS